MSDGDFLEAIKIGRIWAGYTCLQLGACSDPPNKDELEKFARKTDNLLRQKRIRNVQIVDPYDFDRALQTFDAALSD